MNKELQKEILKIFCEKDTNYSLSKKELIEKINKSYFNNYSQGVSREGIPSFVVIEKCLNYLLDDGSVFETDYKNHYRLTKWGELQIKGNYFQFAWHWLIYRKHNLAVLISIISLILSIISLL